MRNAKESGKAGKSENRDGEVNVQHRTRSWQGEKERRERKEGGEDREKEKKREKEKEKRRKEKGLKKDCEVESSVSSQGVNKMRKTKLVSMAAFRQLR